MKIYLIRHGQTTGDVEDRFGGAYEDHLTEEGQQQAQGLAEKLKDTGIEVLFCSPLIRAQESGRILTEKLSTSIETVQDLRERNHYGVMTGMIKTEAKEKYPHLIELLSDTKNTIEDGETYDEFKQRVMNIWKDLISKNYNTIAMITHGGVIRVIFRELLQKGEIKIGDCAYAVIESNNGELELTSTDGIEIS